MISIDNEQLSVKVDAMGAELKSVWHEASKTEFMWQADPSIWARTSPVLFPIVGKVKHDKLKINGSEWSITQHGFARDMVFDVVKHNHNEVLFRLQSNEQTLALYPYPFELFIGYTLSQHTLTCHWKVVNRGDGVMYFSIGAHPGFVLPTGKMDDYELLFEHPETAGRVMLEGGLLREETKPLLINSNRLSLHKTLFDEDAIVFKHLQSNQIRLQHKTGSYAVEMRWQQMPYLGIWSKKGCEQFVCIEPWLGHADSVNGHEDISLKEGILKLEAGAVFETSYQMTFQP